MLDEQRIARLGLLLLATSVLALGSFNVLGSRYSFWNLWLFLLGVISSGLISLRCHRGNRLNWFLGFGIDQRFIKRYPDQQIPIVGFRIGVRFLAVGVGFTIGG